MAFSHGLRFLLWWGSILLIGATDEQISSDQLAPMVSKELKVVLSLAEGLLWDSPGALFLLSLSPQA